MDTSTLYDELAEHLNQGIIGSPKSPALMEILEILFPVEDAKIAVKLPMQNTPLSELKKLYPGREQELEGILTRMIGRGTVFTSQKEGKERNYRLLPSVVGWSETPFWAARDTESTRKLSPLWLRYREEAFGAELARNDMPVMRVIPVSKTLRDSREVLPFDELKPMLEVADYHAVANCPCRLMKRNVGEGCDHSLENCLHFGSMGRYMVEQGMARKINPEEALGILEAANEEGLVHTADNLAGHLSTICNCCGCCCVFLETKTKLGLHTISTSNYVAAVDSDACSACGTCEERCPVGAVTVGDEDAAVVDPTRCIGCGVCTPTCPSEAIDLSLRGEVNPPPDPSKFLKARFKRS